YTTDKEGFYKEATRTFDAVSDKSTGTVGEKVPSQQYYVIVKGKDLPVDPTKPLDPNNNPVDPTNPTPENPTKPRDPETPVTPKPEDKVPNDPKGRTYGELGLVEQVTRTINYVKNDGSKAAEPVKETLTFTR
ncbi:mucin-binding protein, partial [Streptococcus mitis]